MIATRGRERPLTVAPGIHKVEGLRMSNAYIIETAEGLLVVDTGVPGSAKHTVRTIERLGKRPEDVQLIVLTHWHADHIGSARELRQRTGARLAIHELDAAILAGGELPARGRRQQRLIRWLFRVRPVTADQLLRDGDQVAGWRVLHVAGHTAGSIALHRDGVVVTGDALLGDRHGHIRPPDPRLSQDPQTATRSADRIMALAPSLVLPGHGAPATPSRRGAERPQLAGNRVVGRSAATTAARPNAEASRGEGRNNVSRGVPAPSIYIEAPPEKVFGFWADPANLAKLGGQLPYFEEAIEDVRITPEGAGTTFRTIIKVKGVRLGSVTDRYTDVEKNRRIVDEPSSPNPRMVITFAQEGPGTRVSMEAVVISWPARVPILRDWWRDFHHRRFRTGLLTLKRLMEEPAA